MEAAAEPAPFYQDLDKKSKVKKSLLAIIYKLQCNNRNRPKNARKPGTPLKDYNSDFVGQESKKDGRKRVERMNGWMDGQID